jgi:hypothetical protein
MDRDPDRADPTAPYRRLVQRVVSGGIPQGDAFDACRAVLGSAPSPETRFHALCTLLEGALADPGLSIEETQLLVPLLKGLARGSIAPEDVL